MGLRTARSSGTTSGEAQAWTQRLLRDHAASDYGTDALLKLAAAAGPRPDVARQAYRDLLTRTTPADVRADAWFGLAETSLAAKDGGKLSARPRGSSGTCPRAIPARRALTSSWSRLSRRRASPTAR